MAGRHEGVPRGGSLTLRKTGLLELLRTIDESPESRYRVLSMECEFRHRINLHLQSLPVSSALFSKFRTSPYVLLIHARHNHYTRISQIEHDIIPAKQFASMETSAGRMVEEVALRTFGWEPVPSGMHTGNSALDGRRIEDSLLRLATLKSGPRCLNDEMSDNFADAIVNNFEDWALEAQKTRIDFTYGVLYGTRKESNKKDWHILRNIKRKRPGWITVDPENQWLCAFVSRGISVDVTIRIGIEWWTHLGGNTCFIELLTALIRACIDPGEPDPSTSRYTISDLNSIVSMESVSDNFNVSILQRSQIPWLFFMARHFCDNLTD